MAKGKLLAEGTHQYFEDGKEVGRETWDVSQLGHGGIIISSRVEFALPQPRTMIVTYELDRAWAPVSVALRLEENGRRVLSNQRVQDDHWVATIETGEPANNYELAFSPATEIDFTSPLFHTVTLLRTRLPVGAERDLDAIVIAADSLTPSAEKQHYACVGEDKFEVPAGKFPALQYKKSRPAQSGTSDELWADHHGFVLLYRSPAREIKLARYRITERR